MRGRLKVLHAPEIHSGRVFFRRENHVDQAHSRIPVEAENGIVDQHDGRAAVVTDMEWIQLTKSRSGRLAALLRAFGCSDLGCLLENKLRQISSISHARNASSDKSQ